MSFFLINLYEFGQFLRIFLWISLPMVTILLLVTTYFHYRRKREQREGFVFLVDGYGEMNESTGWQEKKEEALTLVQKEEEGAGHNEEGAGRNEEGAGPASDDPDGYTGAANENMYRGILWMKEKYEQYRNLADKRYEELREELNRAEKRYQDLLATVEESKMRPLSAGGRVIGGERVDGGMVGEENGGASDAEKDSFRDIVEEKNRQIHFLQSQLDQRIKNYHQLEYQGRDNRGRLEELEKLYAAAQLDLEERQRLIDGKDGRLHDMDGYLQAERSKVEEMDGYLKIERNKVEELVVKLQSNSLLLMNIYKELDKSLNIAGSVENPA